MVTSSDLPATLFGSGELCHTSSQPQHGFKICRSRTPRDPFFKTRSTLREEKVEGVQTHVKS